MSRFLWFTVYLYYCSIVSLCTL